MSLRIVFISVAGNARNGGAISPGSNRWRNDCAPMNGGWRPRSRGSFAGWQAPEGGAGQPGFAKKLIERHGKLARSIAAIDAQIDEVGAALGAAEQELKRYELGAARHATRTGSPEPRRARRSQRARQVVPPIAGPDG